MYYSQNTLWIVSQPSGVYFPNHLFNFYRNWSHVIKKWNYKNICMFSLSVLCHSPLQFVDVISHWEWFSNKKIVKIKQTSIYNKKKIVFHQWRPQLYTLTDINVVIILGSLNCLQPYFPIHNRIQNKLLYIDEIEFKP